MSSNRQETVADIVREMREVWAVNYWCEGCKTMNGDYPDVVAITTAELADRIEAAHKRESESGAEKMRENLGEVMHKKYTAQKIREMEAIVASGDIGPITRESFALMLKQAEEMRDRLDEAIRRGATIAESSVVGNAAEMRKALEEVRFYLPFFLQYMRLNREDEEAGGYYERILEVVNAALSAQPRNCDAYNTVDDAVSRAIHLGMVDSGFGAREMAEFLLAEAKGEMK